MNPKETSMEAPSFVAPPVVAAEAEAASKGPQLVLRPEDYPNIDNLITEDGAPVDSMYAEKQQRLLTETLYSSWQPSEDDPRFVVLSNVGLFSTTERPPLVPDCLLSLEVECPRNLHRKEHHSYYLWLYGKPPDVVVEIVSDRRGGEEDYKMSEYARMRVPYYVLYDPNNRLGGGVLRVKQLQRLRYRAVTSTWMPGVGLGLTLWQGVYEGAEESWLRWCDRERQIIPTGRERAEQEKQRAEQEKQRADEAGERLKRLEAQLRALGHDPTS